LVAHGSYPPEAPVIRASLPLISLSTTMTSMFGQKCCYRSFANTYHVPTYRTLVIDEPRPYKEELHSGRRLNSQQGATREDLSFR
jgi:hypothetical protein